MTGSYRIAGVGGQGVISFAKAISNILMNEGLNPVMSEIHGLSQRGGSVVSDIKFDGAKSPILTGKEAEILVAMKTSEAISNIDILKENGICIGNRRNDNGEEVAIGKIDGRTAYWVDCQKIAGNDQNGSVNMILLGFISSMDRKIPFDETLKYVYGAFGSKYTERNTLMLKKGYDAGFKIFGNQRA
ncbi:MAG: 2-oxoacid:acceptor oxidoreductase family protein [Candidatus Thermoplasmatota archaeon]|nr:2-oxoacid:acceptor oxidoreductase family protein [Candidatus Thermoplasmatota archaeon]MCL5889265.1 2-oxoacid:acceptor oxidoreductase family protein [Candidatus Thermoplasmatota archaeon]